MKEIDDLAQETSSSLRKVINDNSEGKFEDYTKKQSLAVRDKLVAVAAANLGRRIKEMMKMTIEEVKKQRK